MPYAKTCEDATRLLRYISESGIPTNCQYFSSCEALMANFVPGRYDLIFLDIYMGNVQQGIDAAAKIRETDAMVTLAFTTSSEEHALEGYRLKAIAYLEKPLHSTDVREVLEHAVSRRKNAPAVRLLVGGKDQEVPLQTILYFEHKDACICKYSFRHNTDEPNMSLKISSLNCRSDLFMSSKLLPIFVT